ncbi:MAG: 16S rRNA (cytosine(1402)-N(4))-methyltransferase RsmH [Myxococcota bacterium]|nr:16S rRNA (cytosine(1402)-N(4))-methyltransferase RsmH [Myxococcota bacterium]MDW8362530.1 16S rRNA (cytosine(1402)-N(4))-methyltransferase RsmH [Myxococcales bacterium]
MSGFAHVPVMLAEVLAAIAPAPGGCYADVTIGGGGHAAAILDASAPDGRLIGLDRDPTAVRAACERLAPYGSRAIVRHARMSELPDQLESVGWGRLDGIVADLGCSSPQLDDPTRGFSFRLDGPLDMRMDPTVGPTASELLRELREVDLARILADYGQEPRARAIARSIVRAREAGRLRSTVELRRAVLRATGPSRGRIDPATRTFQALRIAVNEELSELDALLRAGPDLLADRGVIVVVSFHSLEDGLVKQAFRADARLQPLTRGPVRPSLREVRGNPRARSARLRAARRRPRGVEEGT